MKNFILALIVAFTAIFANAATPVQPTVIVRMPDFSHYFPVATGMSRDFIIVVNDPLDRPPIVDDSVT